MHRKYLVFYSFYNLAVRIDHINYSYYQEKDFYRDLRSL